MTKGKPKAMTEVQKIVDRIDINNNNAYYESPFCYGIEVEYDRYNDCENNGCDSICRCGVLENARVISVNIKSIIEQLLGGDHRKKNVITNPFLRYCVDRIVRINKLYDTNNWEPNITGGYYGEECHGGDLNPSLKQKLVNEINSLEGFAHIDTIKEVLKLEYGYLLPKIKHLTQAEIIEVETDHIKLFNDDYSKKVSQEAVDHYADYDFPRAICTKSNGLIPVIDGFHRMIAAQKNNLKQVPIIMLS